jgi:hypothetical protein
MSAVDLLPLAAGETQIARPYACTVYRNTGINDAKAYFDPPIDSTLLCAGRWKLIVYHAVAQAGAAAQVQLFDLQADPHEQQNLASDPQAAPVLQRLLLLLADWLQEQGRGLESRGGQALPGSAWTSVIDNRFAG